ncbi:MAG: hypothetical protein LBN40_05295 [Oscillospiraceae bacterium]|jgi:hypothetical protein|nr:hypothetical protein [Oscillospiraceae bacterium]
MKRQNILKVVACSLAIVLLPQTSLVPNAATTTKTLKLSDYSFTATYDSTYTKMSQTVGGYISVTNSAVVNKTKLNTYLQTKQSIPLKSSVYELAYTIFAPSEKTVDTAAFLFNTSTKKFLSSGEIEKIEKIGSYTKVTKEFKLTESATATIILRADEKGRTLIKDVVLTEVPYGTELTLGTLKFQLAYAPRDTKFSKTADGYLSVVNSTRVNAKEFNTYLTSIKSPVTLPKDTYELSYAIKTTSRSASETAVYLYDAATEKQLAQKGVTTTEPSGDWLIVKKVFEIKSSQKVYFLIDPRERGTTLLKDLKFSTVMASDYGDKYLSLGVYLVDGTGFADDIDEQVASTTKVFKEAVQDVYGITITDIKIQHVTSTDLRRLALYWNGVTEGQTEFDALSILPTDTDVRFVFYGYGQIGYYNKDIDLHMANAAKGMADDVSLIAYRHIPYLLEKDVPIPNPYITPTDVNVEAMLHAFTHTLEYNAYNGRNVTDTVFKHNVYKAADYNVPVYKIFSTMNLKDWENGLERRKYNSVTYKKYF